MRLVRLGAQPTSVGDDVRVALSTWGGGDGVLGGVAAFGCTPVGCTSPLDAVLILPRGVIIVLGVDLADPVLRLEAPLQTPWTIDGWPLVRPEGAVNPGLEALESATALAKSLQEVGAEPLPVSAIVAVGPYVGHVSQPTADLHRGVRVVSPSTRTLLAAARELATYGRRCSAPAAAKILQVVDHTGILTTEHLLGEGFPENESAGMGTAQTVLIPRVGDGPRRIGAGGDRPTPEEDEQYAATVARRRKAAMIAVAAIVLGIIVVLMLAAGAATMSSQRNPNTPPVLRSGGIAFTEQAMTQDEDCAGHSYGDIQAWFDEHGCARIHRTVYGAEIDRRKAGVAIAVIDLPDLDSATKLHSLFTKAGTGGVTDLVSDLHRWEGGPTSFVNSALAVERTGTQLRIVQAVWSTGVSDPADVSLRVLAENGLHLPISR